MNTRSFGPVWIHPPRFWKAVEGKSEDEVADLLEFITKLLAEGRTEILLQYDFVTGVGYPYPNSSRQAGKTRKPAA
jgi:hypothetical protein